MEVVLQQLRGSATAPALARALDASVELLVSTASLATTQSVVSGTFSLSSCSLSGCCLPLTVTLSILLARCRADSTREQAREECLVHAQRPARALEAGDSSLLHTCE